MSSNPVGSSDPNNNAPLFSGSSPESQNPEKNSTQKTNEVVVKGDKRKYEGTPDNKAPQSTKKIKAEITEVKSTTANVATHNPIAKQALHVVSATRKPAAARAHVSLAKIAPSSKPLALQKPAAQTLPGTTIADLVKKLEEIKNSMARHEAAGLYKNNEGLKNLKTQITNTIDELKNLIFILDAQNNNYKMTRDLTSAKKPFKPASSFSHETMAKKDTLEKAAQPTYIPGLRRDIESNIAGDEAAGLYKNNEGLKNLKTQMYNTLDAIDKVISTLFLVRKNYHNIIAKIERESTDELSKPASSFAKENVAEKDAVENMELEHTSSTDAEDDTKEKIELEKENA